VFQEHVLGDHFTVRSERSYSILGFILSKETLGFILLKETPKMRFMHQLDRIHLYLLAVALGKDCIQNLRLTKNLL